MTDLADTIEMLNFGAAWEYLFATGRPLPAAGAEQLHQAFEIAVMTEVRGAARGRTFFAAVSTALSWLEITHGWEVVGPGDVGVDPPRLDDWRQRREEDLMAQPYFLALARSYAIATGRQAPPPSGTTPMHIGASPALDRGGQGPVDPPEVAR